jgi:hypothetical protein
VAVTLKRVHRPSRLSVIVKAPDGSPITRWAQDEPNLENVFSGLTFSGEMPGGHKELTLRLARDPKRSYRDLALFNRIEVYSSDGERVWCGTIRQEPTSDGDQQSIEVKAAGDMQFLEDDPTIVGPGFIDSDMSKLGGPSTQRHINLMPTAGIYTPASGEVDNGWQGDGSAPPSALVTLRFDNGHPIAEVWYRGEGAPVGRLIFDFFTVGTVNPEDEHNFHAIARIVSDDLVGSTAAQSVDYHFTGAATQEINGVGADVLFQIFYEGPYVGEGTNSAGWRNVKVIGPQGLQLQGSYPTWGFLAKQMIPYILEGSVLTTDPELLEDDEFVITQAWFSAPGTRMSKLIEVTKYGLLDWFVFGDRILQYRFPGTYGRTWRLGPGNAPKNSGADANQVFDRLLVSYQDVDGTTKYTPLLTTTDPSNPAAAAGVPRGKLLALNGVCTEELALEVRQRAFEELQNLSQSGEVTLTDHVQDEASGAWYPVSYVQPGDRVREQSNGHERKVTSTSYTDDSVSNALTIGAPPNGIESIEAIFNGKLIELGLGG